jgi:hypothetical protein
LEFIALGHLLLVVDLVPAVIVLLLLTHQLLLVLQLNVILKHLLLMLQFLHLQLTHLVELDFILQMILLDLIDLAVLRFETLLVILLPCQVIVSQLINLLELLLSQLNLLIMKRMQTLDVIKCVVGGVLQLSLAPEGRWVAPHLLGRILLLLNLKLVQIREVGLLAQ